MDAHATATPPEHRRLWADQRFRQLLEAAPDAMVIVDQHGKIALINGQAEQMFGYQRDELLGQPVELLIPRELCFTHVQERKDYMAHPHVRPMHAGRGLRAVRKGGSAFPAEISLSPLQTEEGLLIISAIRDATERKYLEGLLREQETQLIAARDIQQRLLPRSAPTLPGFDMAGASYPAEFAGGDYFDFLTLGPQSLGLVIADVAGHGIGPALLMASTRSLVHLLTDTETDLAHVLARANDHLQRETDEEHFVTLLLLRLDLCSGAMVYANAGHPAGYVLRADGAVSAQLESGAPPLGIVAGIGFPTATSPPLIAGDLLLLLTDGVTEARSTAGESFGAQRALELVHCHRHHSAHEIVHHLCQEVRRFSHEQRLIDDVTAVVLKVEHPAPGKPGG